MQIRVVLLVILTILNYTHSIRFGEAVAEDSKYDYMVGIIRTNITKHSPMLYCGGTFIRNNIILTTGHCLSDYFTNETETHIVYFVQYKVPEIDVNNNLGIQINREHVQFHPNYTVNKCTEFDLALIALPISDDLFPPPIDLCEQEQSTDVNSPIFISWINHTAPFGPYKLNYAELSIIDTKQCQSGKALTNHEICTVGKKRETSSRGDSGSPLINPEQPCQFGILYCRYGNNMLFVNVLNFTWIDKTVQKLNKERGSTTEIINTTTIEDDRKSEITTQKIETATKTTSETDTTIEESTRYIYLSFGLLLVLICVIIVFYARRRIKNRQNAQEQYSYNQPTVEYKVCEIRNEQI